jgi:hypothetical protein
MTNDKPKPEEDPVIEKKTHQLPSAGPHQTLVVDVRNMGMFEFGGEKKPRWALELELDERDSKTGKPLTQLVFFSLTIEPKSRLLTILIELGITPGERFRPKSLIGLRCGVVIKHVKKDDGTIRSEVASFYPLPSVGAAGKFKPTGANGSDEIVVRKPEPEDPNTISDADVIF